MPSRIFLLSPASLNGVRAKQLASPRAAFDAAMRFRSSDGVPVAEAFAFMSALYFRGKIAYARRFADDGAIFVITPGFGLVDPEWRITRERFRKMQRTGISLDSRAYVRPLREHARRLQADLDAAVEVVLLGSVATGKYVDVLRPILGERLRFPSAFAGLGDMARGGLMLRAAREGKELEYVTLDAPRNRLPGATGKMPAL